MWNYLMENLRLHKLWCYLRYRKMLLKKLHKLNRPLKLFNCGLERSRKSSLNSQPISIYLLPVNFSKI